MTNQDNLVSAILKAISELRNSYLQNGAYIVLARGLLKVGDIDEAHGVARKIRGSYGRDQVLLEILECVVGLKSASPELQMHILQGLSSKSAAKRAMGIMKSKR